MSKIIKYTFKIPNLKLKNNELVQEGFSEETYTFTLLHKGIGIYEEMAKESLIQSLVNIGNIDDENSISKLVNSEFITNLSSASYVKIEDGKWHNNRATAEEFKKLPIANHLDDLAFITKILEMATECVVGNIGNTKKSNKNKHTNPKDELQKK